MKKCTHKIKNMPLQPSSICACPWQMSQSAFLPLKPSVELYSERKPRARQKLGNGPGVSKCPAPGQCKIWKCPTLGTDKVGKCPAVAREGGWAQVELTGAPPNQTFYTVLHNPRHSSALAIWISTSLWGLKRKTLHLRISPAVRCVRHMLTAWILRQTRQQK